MPRRELLCPDCGAPFNDRSHLKRHRSYACQMSRSIPPPAHTCESCGWSTRYLSNLRRHRRNGCPVLRKATTDTLCRGPIGIPPSPMEPTRSSSSSASAYTPPPRSSPIRRPSPEPEESGGTSPPRPSPAPEPVQGTSGTRPPSPPISDDEDNEEGSYPDLNSQTHIMSSSDEDDDDDDDDAPPRLPNNLGPAGYEEVQTAFRGRLKTYRLKNKGTIHVTIPEFLNTTIKGLTTLVRRVLLSVHAVKMNLWLECEFVNVHEDSCRYAFKTKNVPIFRTSDVDQLCGELFQKLVDEYNTCAMKGSGWSFLRVLELEIRVNVYRPLGGSSFLPLPDHIAQKKAVVNVENRGDEYCFRYAVLTYFLDPARRRRGRLTPADFTPDVYDRAGLDFSDLDFPVPLAQIPRFEKKNGVSVNVYGLERDDRDREERVYPLRVAKRERPVHFDLLFVTDHLTTHYAFITDLSRLVGSQLTRRNGRVHLCRRCFAHFDDQPNRQGLTGAQRLEQHRRYCDEHAAVRTDPPKKEQLRFERFECTQRARFSIFADFESLLVPIDEAVPLRPPATVRPPVWDPATARGGLPHRHHHHRRGATAAFDSPNVRTENMHRPYAYSYFVHDSFHRPGQADDGSTFTVLRHYRSTGDVADAARHFMRSITADVKRIAQLLYDQRQRVPLLTAAEQAAFRAATECYLCRRPFGLTRRGRPDKVRDHLHCAPYSYLGAAHNKCNLMRRNQTKVNCYFHNLSNYDAHFVVRELGLDGGDVRVLANTEEKYITFSKMIPHPGAGRHDCMWLQFTDSYRFLSRSLAFFADITPVDKLLWTAHHFPDPDQFDLVRRKGVFPYEHVTSLRVLDRNSLPPREAFYNRLTLEDVSPEDYAHAQRVWETFNCDTLGDYSDVYLKTDVLLLADIFEEFRTQCMAHYDLDPAHWPTVPSYAWSVMMYKTGVVLDTLADKDMYLFFEKGVRGGLVQCVTRHVEADNRYVRAAAAGLPPPPPPPAGTKPSDARPDDNYIMYYDANNLYGWAMSQPLPFADFEWLDQRDIDALRIEDVAEDADFGYVLEVDLDYPRDRATQDRHRDLPFCPELRKAPIDQLPYPRDVLHDFNVGKTAKLMATQCDKRSYVIHYRLLQQALENGLRVSRIHRVIRFRQRPWLRDYVALNTELRRRATNKFEVELFKLMVNAVYGMSLQNVRKRIDVRLVTKPSTYTKCVAKSNFSDRTWLNENLALMHMRKTHIVLDKPVYAGMCILDHSKWWMYRFHYSMVERYGLQRIRLIYMDTDSLVYDLRTADAYADMLPHKEEFDCSKYPRDHFCYDPSNAMVLGKFKDEANGTPVVEFVGLMSKLYCLLQLDGSLTKRAKGTNKGVVQHRVTVEDYRACLRDFAVVNTENRRFQSRHHIIYTTAVTKRSLAPYDDKRYVIPEDDGFQTLPWGHYLVPEPMDQDDVEADE